MVTVQSPDSGRTVLVSPRRTNCQPRWVSPERNAARLRSDHNNSAAATISVAATRRVLNRFIAGSVLPTGIGPAPARGPLSRSPEPGRLGQVPFQHIDGVPDNLGRPPVPTP